MIDRTNERGCPVAHFEGSIYALFDRRRKTLAFRQQRFTATSKLLLGAYISMTVFALTSALAITDGQEDDAGKYSYVVRLDAHGRHPETGKDLSARGFCSGILLAPRVVLTALHCVRMVKPGILVAIKDERTSTLSLGKIRTKNLEPGPEKSDVAIIILESDASSRGIWAELSCGPPNEDTPLTLVGYGKTTGWFDNRYAHSRYFGYNFGKCDPKDDTPVSFTQNLAKLNDRIKVLSFALPGDSGGPIVGLDGKTVYGVASLELSGLGKVQYSDYWPVFSKPVRKFLQETKRKFPFEFSSIKLCPP